MIKYMRHIFIFIVVWLAAGTICSFAQYKPDRLGEGFEAKTIVMPDDYLSLIHISAPTRRS